VEKATSRRSFLPVDPAHILSNLTVVIFFAFLIVFAMACAATDSRRIARTTPVARPAGEAEKSALPDAAASSADSGEKAADKASVERAVEAIIARAQEEYERGVEALRSGDSEEARERFDTAVQLFVNSSIPVDENSKLKKAYGKMVDDITALEKDLGEAPGGAPDATPSPTEGLEDINTSISPEEAEKELEKVAPETTAVSFDIPMVVNDKVLAWVEIFRNRREFRESFIGGYQRFGWYEEMIHRTLKEEGMPADLIYMAFLESTYKTSAYSRARARGIWQFMTPTGREYGLKVNRYVDERAQPEKSTRAAVRYMKDLYNTLGDWHLAIAAYNTGAGNIMRAQRRSGRTNYWDLAKTKFMRTETKNFVPAILALALISKDPAKYGFEGVEHNPTLRFDRVNVTGPTSLSTIAQLAECSVDELKFLNPHLRLLVTPPGERDYEVLVPEGRGERFLAAYLAMPEDERTARLANVHTVRRGETLASIAARYGTTVQELKASNNIRNARLLSVGAEISVPNVPGGSPAYSDDSVARPRRSSRGNPYHVVRRGETLSSISRAYGVSLKNVLQWNGMTSSSIIKPGTRLVVGRSASSTGTVRPTGKVPSSAGLVSVPGGGQAPPDPAGEKLQYRVRRGDNLYRIALKYGTTVENLKAWNSISGNDIVAGAILTIYPN